MIAQGRIVSSFALNPDFGTSVGDVRRSGRITRLPWQLGQLCSSDALQSGQKVHS